MIEEEWGEHEGEDDDGRMSSFVFATLIVDELFHAHLLLDVPLRSVLESVTRTIAAHKATGEYDGMEHTERSTSAALARALVVQLIAAGFVASASEVEAAKSVVDKIENRRLLGDY